jgi:2-dehydro-3-deoxyglucarate aldolase
MDRVAAVTALRARLKQGEAVIGAWMQIPHPSIAEIMGQCGYDWVALDLEHGAMSTHQLPDVLRALELGGALALARLAEGSVLACKQALDAGAAGVIVPMIESAAQLSAVRAACRWPPAGSRGVGFSRANLFGKRFETYMTEAQSPLLVAMIEHAHAVEALADILAVEGLDAVLVGPYDLSASMGLTGRFDEPRCVRTMEAIKARCAEAQVPCGIHVVTPDPQVLAARLGEGYRFVAYGTDALFLMKGATRG